MVEAVIFPLHGYKVFVKSIFQVGLNVKLTISQLITLIQNP